jgi:hypothetical protein
MLRYGIPLTRENYLEADSLDELDEIGPEIEEGIPELLREGAELPKKA